MKAEEILATYCTGSMFILERQDVVVGILQDNGVKKKDAEKAYSIFKQNHPFGYSGDDVPPVDIDMFFRAGMRYLDAADDLVSFKKAYWTLFVAAVRGHPEALFRLGMLMGGEYEGCPFTEVRSAVKFFRKADEKGHPDAKLHLALLIADGFRPDTAEEAMSLMEVEVSAADAGEDADTLLDAIAGLRGGDAAPALEKLVSLSEKGVSEASVILDAVYREGYRTEKDPGLADRYWRSVSF